MNDSLNDICELFPDVSKQLQMNTNNIQILENNLKFIGIKNENIKNLQNDINKRLSYIEEKTKDMNILGMFNGLGGEDGDNAQMVKLINNLENKYTEKINLLEEKLKKIEETNYKTSRDVVRVLNTFDLNKRTFEHVNENIESLEKKVDTFEQESNTKFEEINTRYDNKINNLEKAIEELNDKLEKNLKSDKKEKTTIESNEAHEKKFKLNLENNEKIKEITEHLAELDKFIKSYVQRSGVDQIKSDISSLKTAIWNCSTLDDIKETKEREDDLQKQISLLKESIDDLITNQIDRDDFMNYKSKVESLLHRLNELDNNLADILSRKNMFEEKNKKNNGPNKFLEIKKFEEFRTSIIKEFTNVNDNFNLLRGLTDRLSDALNTKPSFNDMKALEEDFDAKLEDLKLTLSKKFADRVESNKNFKFLDQQLKNIVQIYIKKNEKESSNWLIAKKPLNSNLCASCDSYIGDLKENSNFVPWNKYPNREGEKLYRLGNGFSKMLQLVHMDENDKKDIGVIHNENNTQYTDANKDENNKIFDKGLPKIKNNFNQTKSYFYTNANINNLNPEDDESNDKKQNKKEKDEQPKITKIYRMIKENV